MKLCMCRRPARDATNPDRLRCLTCGHWTPRGSLPNPDTVTLLANEISSLVATLAADYRYAHSAAHQPTRRPQEGRGGGHSDPTWDHAADEHRARTNACATIAARLLERATHDLRSADEAIGDALLAAEPSGPADHVQAPYHDPATLFPGRPDLQDAHAAQARRQQRGEL